MKTATGLVQLALVLALAPAARAQTNVLILILDDVGVDRIGAYAEHTDPGRTPNIDALAAGGILFRNAYGNPLCSPTRAGLLTGRYAYRTGVGSNVTETGGPELSLSETILPEALPTYANAAVGKWHLSDDPTHPNTSGFDYFAGPLRNLDRQGTGEASYWQWTKVTNGALSISTDYATTDNTDEAIQQIQTLAEPWLVYCSFTGAHTPTHEPPAHLHTYTLPADPEDDIPLSTRAMVESVDTEIGRLLAATPANTLVVLLGDNGTSRSATDAPFPQEHAKGTVFEGGINVPLVISGPGVSAGVCDGLVNVTDVYATVLDVAGEQSTAEDSVSLVPYFANPALPSLRPWAYSERFNGAIVRRCIRDARYKLIRSWTATGYDERFYDLQVDPFEQVDLLRLGTLSAAEEASYQTLSCAMPPGPGEVVYCPGEVNSTGGPATVHAEGSASLEVGALCVRAEGVPVNETGYFLASPNQGFIANPGGSAGNLCLSPPFARYVALAQSSGAAGRIEHEIDLAAIPTVPFQPVLPGQTWNFQAWFRDGTTSNFSAAMSILFE